MSFRQDYIMSQIEKVIQLIAAMISSKKAEIKQETIDEALGELTGLDSSFFSDENGVSLLGSMLSLLPDDNQKALVARLLQLKNPDLYGDLCQGLMSQIKLENLDPKIQALLSQKNGL